ncbi:hypothetical protein [Micromonospora sp. KC721]|uniref:hypothetical protein n=1 Tax=Micromonospora sp. KC721 TaxID=2530380 RepID=UPI001FB822B5|nr:hypothetical protein [Micromonospora sp. KC721]
MGDGRSSIPDAEETGHAHSPIPHPPWPRLAPRRGDRDGGGRRHRPGRPRCRAGVGDPAGYPVEATAQSQLNALTVRAEGSMSGYSRDKFPHWITISGTCNTREQVLKRDGTNVVVNSSCAVVLPVHLQQDVDHREAQLGLTLQSSEKSALQSMLNTCSS